MSRKLRTGTGDRRRQRLAQPLYHENCRSPSLDLRASNSLPTLPSLHPTKSARFDLDAAKEQVLLAPQLSPLKFTRPSEAVRTDRSFVSRDSQLPAQIDSLPHTATSSKMIPIPISSCRPSTRARLGGSAFSPTRMDRTISEQQTNYDVNNDKELKQRREVALEKHTQQLEIKRRRATVAAASQSFFDQVATLPVREAIPIFEAQREALMNFCLLQFRGKVDDDEIETIRVSTSEVARMIAKVEKELQHKLDKQQKEETQVAQKKIALQQLKKYHHEQIEQHLVNSKEQRKQEMLVARECVVKEQERLDTNVVTRELERQQLTKAYSKKLAEQMKNNVVARSTFQPNVQGSSPLYRTPWWSDESDERLKGFQQPTAQTPAYSPVINCKKRCQWYD